MKIYPVTVRKVLGGGITPTFIYNELRKIKDVVILMITGTEKRTAKDAFNLNITGTEKRTSSDAYLIPSINLLAPEKRTSADTATFTVGPLTAVTRSGTPDSDDWGDAWTDNTVGQTGTNHGNVSPLATAPGVLGVGINLVWVEINLTRFLGLTATGGGHIFSIWAQEGSALTGGLFTLSGGGNVSRPFVESTITQANQPATPSGFALTGSPGLPAPGSFTKVTFTLSDANLQILLGKWALFQLVSSDGTVATPTQISSREGLAANRMALTFTAKV